MLLPPFDVQWVWHCHCLTPVSYRKYCVSRFSKLIEKPAIFDQEIEDYAVNRCREVWNLRYPSEPFDLDIESDIVDDDAVVPTSTNNDLLVAVSKQKDLYSKFSRPFVSETVYLIAARNRYKRFLSLLQIYRDGFSRLVPTSDILLLWLTHQSFPSTYEWDTREIEEDLVKIVSIWDPVKEEDIEVTKKLWEEAFDQPLERAGASFGWTFPARSPVYWEVSDIDVNRKHKAMAPRFLLEVCVFVKGKLDEKGGKEKKNFLRLRTVRCHGELKIDKPISEMSLESWQKRWHLFSEFSTRGIVVEFRQKGDGCLRNSKLRKILVFLWNDLLRAPCLTLAREVDWQLRAVASITPPVQASYLLKCVPDRVTDDKGAMISDLILKMNRYRPQEGCWLSRTVLDHAGRECFVIRIRVGRGFWRRGAETPTAVNWVDRIIEIREGSWSYVVGSIGTAPEKVVGTATPKEEDSQAKIASWCLSTGHVLTIRWEGGLNFHLHSENPEEESSVMLLPGRKMHYQVKRESSEAKTNKEEEEGFLTLVRFLPEKPNGKATALLNWKLFAMEFLPEEDAVLILLLCTAIVRSVSEIWKEGVGRLLMRRRVKETKVGIRDWGSVMLDPSSPSFSPSSAHLRSWYWNAKEVLAPNEADYTRQTNYSPADGGDGLYRRGIIP